MTCKAVHPELEAPCLRVSKNHPQHTARVDDSTVDWDNPEYKVPTSKGVKGDDANRKKIKEMASKIKGESTRGNYGVFYPSEETLLGRVALYLIKYIGEWIAQDELEHPTIAKTAAVLNVRSLKNGMGWPIDEKEEDGKLWFRLNSDPRKQSILSK